MLLGEPPARADGARRQPRRHRARCAPRPGCRPICCCSGPDIREAEAQLAAANANVESARAALFPSISADRAGRLRRARRCNTLFMPQSAIYSLAASLTQPVFDGFRLLEPARSAQGPAHRAVAALPQGHHLGLRRRRARADRGARPRRAGAAADARSVATSRRAYELSETQLRAGTIDITTVLNTQRTLFQAQDQLVLVQLHAAAGDRQPVPGARRRLGAAGRDRERSRAGGDARRAEQEGRSMSLVASCPLRSASRSSPRSAAMWCTAQQQQRAEAASARARSRISPRRCSPRARRIADVPIYLDAVGNTKRAQHRDGARRRSAARSSRSPSRKART